MRTEKVLISLKTGQMKIVEVLGDHHKFEKETRTLLTKMKKSNHAKEKMKKLMLISLTERMRHLTTRQSL